LALPSLRLSQVFGSLKRCRKGSLRWLQLKPAAAIARRHRDQTTQFCLVATLFGRDFASNNTLPLLADVKQARRMFGGLCATIPDAGESK
jgi:hypothetical protein